jgi:hypothetical protein
MCTKCSYYFIALNFIATIILVKNTYYDVAPIVDCLLDPHSVLSTLLIKQNLQVEKSP